MAVQSPVHGAKLRVLVIAEACNPEWTSVPLVGYNMARAIAAHPSIDATIVSHVRNREALEKDAIAGIANLEFVDNEVVAKPLYELGKILRGGKAVAWTTNTALAYPSYMYFERQVGRRFRQELKRREFDLIHRVTPVTPTLGSPLASRTRVPMMIGPLNGGLPWPKEYPELRKKEREWLIPLRKAYKLMPYYGSTYRNLAGVISGSRHTESELPRRFQGHRFFLPENGIDPERFPLSDGWTIPTDRFRFVTVGRLVPLKAIDMIVTAMSQSLTLRNCQLDIIGDGPEREALQSLVAENHLTDNVHFHGWLDQRTLGQRLSSAQAFLFPSLKDFGGGVVLEAMASGLPSVVVDYGGPAELVDPQTGIALPLTPREPLTNALREAMEGLAKNPTQCEQMAAAAVAKIRSHFTWSAKANQVVDMYGRILDVSSTSNSTQTTPRETREEALAATC